MKKYLASFLLIVAVGLMSGCVTQLKSDVIPGTDLAGIKQFYVVHLPADERGVDGLIVDRLKAMGYKAIRIEQRDVPNDAEAVVTYQDKWMWDITMYMIQLDIQIRKPVSGIALATGHSLRTSLARKSPSEMVAEVLDDIFKKK